MNLILVDSSGGATGKKKDPLQAARPKFDLAQASGRPTELIYGARAPAGAHELPEWEECLQSKNIKRVVALMDDGEAAARSPDGSSAGYLDALANSFQAVRIDLASAGAGSAVRAACASAKQAGEAVCFHCSDGNARTSIALAQWVLEDYIGGDNCLEACDLVESRKRRSGVEWTPDHMALEFLFAQDTLAGYQFDAAEAERRENQFEERTKGDLDPSSPTADMDKAASSEKKADEPKVRASGLIY